MDKRPALDYFKENFPEREPKNYSAHRKEIYSIAWNCTGQALASGSADAHVLFWNLDSTGLIKSSD